MDPSGTGSFATPAAGEDPAMARLFEHAEWLRGLARRLATDAAEADDLVQETWVAALRARPAFGSNPRGWLATVIRNFARARRRSEGARERREHELSGGERPDDDPAELVARAEAQRRLIAAVLELEEPLRSTVLARYSSGRSCEEIARTTGTNASTVRTRLARAHDKLRERLSRGAHDRDPLGLGALLAGPGGAPVAPGGTPVATAATSMGTVLIGVGIVGKTVKIAAAVVVLLGVLAWTWMGPSRGPDHGDTPAETAAAPALVTQPPLATRSNGGHAADEGTDDRRALERADTQPPPGAPADPPKKPEPVRDATLELCFLRDGVPAPDVTAWVTLESGPGPRGGTVARLASPPEETTARATSDASGWVRFEKLVRWRHVVAFSTQHAPTRPDRVVTQALSAGHKFEIPLGTAAVRGTVYDARGRPVAGATISVSGAGPDPRTKLVIAATATTDAFGRWRIGDLLAAEHDVVLDVDGEFGGPGVTGSRLVPLVANEEVVVDFGSPAGDPLWRGRLLNAFGEPFPCCGRLAAERVASGDRVQCETAADGRFELYCPAGRWIVFAFAAGSSDAGFRLGEFEVPAGGLDQDLVVPGTRLSGRVSGLPSEYGQRANGTLCSVSVRPSEHDYPAAIRSVVIAPDGSYVIDGLEPGVWVVQAWPLALAQGRVEIEITAGAPRVVLDLRLER